MILENLHLQAKKGIALKDYPKSNIFDFSCFPYKTGILQLQ